MVAAVQGQQPSGSDRSIFATNRSAAVVKAYLRDVMVVPFLRDTMGRGRDPDGAGQPLADGADRPKVGRTGLEPATSCRSNPCQRTGPEAGVPPEIESARGSCSARMRSNPMPAHREGYEVEGSGTEIKSVRVV